MTIEKWISKLASRAVAWANATETAQSMDITYYGGVMQCRVLLRGYPIDESDYIRLSWPMRHVDDWRLADRL